MGISVIEAIEKWIMLTRKTPKVRSLGDISGGMFEEILKLKEPASTMTRAIDIHPLSFARDIVGSESVILEGESGIEIAPFCYWFGFASLRITESFYKFPLETFREKCIEELRGFDIYYKNHIPELISKNHSKYRVGWGNFLRRCKVASRFNNDPVKVKIHGVYGGESGGKEIIFDISPIVCNLYWCYV